MELHESDAQFDSFVTRHRGCCASSASRHQCVTDRLCKCACLFACVCFVPVCCFCRWGVALGGAYYCIRMCLFVFIYVYSLFYILFACSVAASRLFLSLSVCPNSFDSINSFNSVQLICLIGWLSQILRDPVNHPHALH